LRIITKYDKILQKIDLFGGGCMRLFPGKIPEIAEQIVDTLISTKLIEVQEDLIGEVRLDIEAVLKEYLRMDRDIMEKAKDVLAKKGENYSQLGKLRAQMAYKLGFGMGDLAIEYIVNQIVEMLFISRNVDEVFGEDNELTAKISPILQKSMGMDEDLDIEVRKRIKNLQEGTVERDIEYQKNLSDIMKSKKF